jgi:hypothetical protein
MSNDSNPSFPNPEFESGSFIRPSRPLLVPKDLGSARRDVQQTDEHFYSSLFLLHRINGLIFIGRCRIPASSSRIASFRPLQTSPRPESRGIGAIDVQQNHHYVSVTLHFALDAAQILSEASRVRAWKLSRNPELTPQI